MVGTTTTVPWQRKSSFISLSTQRVDDRSNPLFSQRHPIRDIQTNFANDSNEFQYVNSHNLPQNKRKQKQLSDFGQSHVFKRLFQGETPSYDSENELLLAADVVLFVITFCWSLLSHL